METTPPTTIYGTLALHSRETATPWEFKNCRSLERRASRISMEGMENDTYRSSYTIGL